MAPSPRITTFNCHFFNKNYEIIRTLLLECDILCLQETQLDANTSIGTQNISEEFNVAYVAAVRADERFTGLSSGGIVNLRKRNIYCKVYSVSYSSRTTGLKLVYEDSVYLLLNIYAFCDYGITESLINYKLHIAELSSICTNGSFTDVIILPKVYS